jgi:hypothetical protein
MIKKREKRGLDREKKEGKTVYHNREMTGQRKVICKEE